MFTLALDHIEEIALIEVSRAQRKGMNMQPNLYIIVWRSQTGSVFQSERYAVTAQRARYSLKRDIERLGVSARILCTKEHTGQRYGNNGRFV